MPLILRTLLRALVLAALYAVAVLVIDRSGTTDALGPGLLLMLAMVLVSLVWAAFDGRRAAAQALVVWLAAALLAGILITLEAALLIDDQGIGLADLGSTIVLMLFLVFPAALLGIGVGVLISRRGR